MTTSSQGNIGGESHDFNPDRMAAQILRAEQKLNTHDLGAVLGVKRGKDGTPIYPGDIEERLGRFLRDSGITDVN